MKSLKDLLCRKNLEKRLSERAELLKFFGDRLTDKKHKPYKWSYLGMKLSHLNVQDLYYLRSVCLDGENRGQPFAKVFWGSLKPNGGAKPLSTVFPKKT